ncbi:MAG: hypothetical protein GF353_18220 [Candidatus Lokiarchaeota archaeon]|nr:hypothetical protein [Candidatus Lokiarchaeota archaeon]
MSFLGIIIDFLLNPWFLLSALFWGIIAISVYLLRNRKESVYVFFPIIALLKTKKLNRIIKKVALKIPKFWRVFWTIGIFISFTFTVFAFFFFFINLINLIFQPRIENAVTPLIPGVTIGLPLFAYLILPLLFIMTTHEFAHGVAANTDGVEVKSTGILGAGLFYIIGMGAFVEVDEREMNSPKYHRNTRLRIASAGTFVNALTAGFAFLLLINFSLMISPLYGAQVLQVDTVLTDEEGGYNEGNLKSGDVIRALKKKGSNDNFIYFNGDKGLSLNALLDNDTNKIDCSVGDELTLKVYNPNSDSYSEKDIILGPRYKIGIAYEYVSNTELKITRVYSKEEDGNNYNTDLEADTIITKINGTYIDVENGDTLEKLLTNFNLTQIKLVSSSGKSFYLDADVDGVLIGILTTLYWMPKNDVAKFLTGNLPDFFLREILWLWIIAFSITIFNMLPLPIFDGFRVVKELVNWGVGENYSQKRRKKERFKFEKDKKSYGLSEYRVEGVDEVKLYLKQKNEFGNDYIEQSEILLAENNYKLEDKIGDGYKSTLTLNLSKNANIEENSIIEVSYEYLYDEKKKTKRTILYAITLFTLFIVAANFILSFIQLGVVTFWL